MTVELPLVFKTPDRWADQVLESPLELLDDHAHLERKAATNALELLNRWPDPEPPERWVTTLASVARDETDHLFKVARLLKNGGGQMSKAHQNNYAKRLRGLVRMGEGPLELVDRLLVSALIELRSCERFEILSRCCSDSKLASLYKMLWGSEHGHFQVFLSLAEDLLPGSDIESRWGHMLEREADIIQSQPVAPILHSSVRKL